MSGSKTTTTLGQHARKRRVNPTNVTATRKKTGENTTIRGKTSSNNDKGRVTVSSNVDKSIANPNLFDKPQSGVGAAYDATFLPSS